MLAEPTHRAVACARRAVAVAAANPYGDPRPSHLLSLRRTPTPKYRDSSVHQLLGVSPPRLGREWPPSKTIREPAAAAGGAFGLSSRSNLDSEEREPLLERLKDGWERIRAQPEVKRALQVSQFAASLLFVVLYVWSTYSSPQPFTWRANLDLFLCVVFAIDYLMRFTEAESKLRMVLSFWNLLDLLAFLPPLLESCLLYIASMPFNLGRFDLRWFKILRALRVMRISLLAGELKQMHLSSRGALLSGAASVRLFQLIASVLTLLFTTSSIIVLVERIPFHMALYFVTTTLTTVGYGDIVMSSFLGKAAVLAMICVGVVLIPVQTSQLYQQLTARRVTLGNFPDKRVPSVLVSTRLTEVRGFSDFFTEFYQALKKSRLPARLHMVVLCNRPNFEFRAYQELNDKRLTIMEGSALSERDLVRARAESATACLLLADRFSPKPEEEDLNLQFQVWALKSYTKRVPLYVQVLQKSSIQLIAPFLDPEQDVLVSTEQTRHRLLALSCLCPGASTLISNLLRRASVRPREGQRRTAGGRRWLRAYLNGCAFKVFDSRLSRSLEKIPFAEAAEWLYRTSGFVLMGVVRDKKVILNPGRRRLEGGETAIVIGTSQEAVDAALSQRFTAAPPLKASGRARPADRKDAATARGPATKARIKSPIPERVSTVIASRAKPVMQATSWLSELTNFVRLKWVSDPEAATSLSMPQREQRTVGEEYFFPEDGMPCVLDSPFCQYDRYADERGPEESPSTADSLPGAEAHTKMVEGYSPLGEAWAMEGSESFDEEDEPESRRRLPELSSSLRMTLSDFYTNLGDLTSPQRRQPGFGTSKAPLNGSAPSLNGENDMGRAQNGAGCKDASECEVDWQFGDEAAAGDLSLDRAAAAVTVQATMEATLTAASAVASPEVMSESYEDDTEDEHAQSVFDAELGENLAESVSDSSVADHVAHSSLERRREPASSTPKIKSLHEDGRTASSNGAAAAGDETDKTESAPFFKSEDYRQKAAADGQSPDRDSGQTEAEDKTEELHDHIIICGAAESFLSFVQQVRKCDPLPTPLVVLHPRLPKSIWPALKALGPVQFIQGNPSDAGSLQAACASQARALVFLAHAHRPYRAEDVPEGEGSESSFASRTAVLADAQGLLTCYGVGEDRFANLPHAVVELCFTSSVRFLQPGLLLKGQGYAEEALSALPEPAGQPRKSWQMRKRQERAAIKEGLAEWQANPYYCAGRVTVPALMDTFACQCFFNRGMLTDLMEELAGDDGRVGGAQLRQLPLPEGMAGRTYGELVASMTLTRKLLPLGLYRRKSENSVWRLYYVVTNPPPEEKLDAGDRVFVLRERGGPWLTTLAASADR